MPVTYTNPTVGGDNGSWGSKLNAVLDAFAAFMDALETSVGLKLPKTGGAMSGLLDLKTTTTAHQNRASASAHALDLAVAQSFATTITGATAFTFLNIPATASALSGFVLRLVNGGSASVTFPASVKWPSGTGPALTLAGTDVLLFLTDDNGTTWRGSLAIKDAR